MSNPIEVPENIISLAKKILEEPTCYGDNSLELANYITLATRPEIKAEPFVIYRVGVRGEDSTYRIGFRVEKDATYSWVSLVLSSDEKEDAYPVSIYSVGVHRDEEIEVLERWTPEPVFGIGEKDDEVGTGREVLIKGTLSCHAVDPDGDVRVEINYAEGLSGDHYVAAKDVAYAGEVK